MANIITKLNEDCCPVVSGVDLGTWLQMIYTSEAEYRSRYATTLTALQSGRAVVNEVRGAWPTNYATMTSARDLGNEAKTVVNTIKTLANESKTVVNTIKDLANEEKTVVNVIKTLANEEKTVINTVKDLANEEKTVINTIKDLANEEKTVINTVKDLANEEKTVINTIKDLANESKTVVNTIKDLANEEKTVVNTIKTLANEVRDDSTTNAAAALAQKTATLNCSFTKPDMVIGSTASINARANAATIYGIIDGVWYACAATEAAFASPADSFAPAVTRISRNYTLSFTASGTLVHSTGATISGTAAEPEIPALTASTFPVAVMKIVLKAGSATRFNAGTTTLGAPGLTTTFTEYSYIPEWITSHAPALDAAAITAVQSASATAIISVSATAVISASATAVISASATAVISASATAVISASATAIVSASITAVQSADISYPAPVTISAAMSTPGAALTSGNALLTLDLDETDITW